MRLVEERNKRNLSQAEVARGSNVSQSMLAMMENGDRSGSDKTKKKLANFFGVTVGYLFFGDKITKRDKDSKEAIE